MRNWRLRTIFLVLVGFAVLAPEPAHAAGGTPAILTLREQAAVYNTWLKNRLEKILPELMRQEGFDMWLVICRENNEDPVFSSLVPFNNLYASRTTMLVFFDRGVEGVERLTVGRSGIGGLYKSVWEPEKIEQWARLVQVIKERNPKKIGINESDVDNYGDGMTASLKKKLLASLPPDFVPRVQSSEHLAIRWLERRSVEELETYPHIVSIAHSIIAEAFTRGVITPGVTTGEDVAWWMRERSRQLGLTNWFHPTVDIQRPKDSPYKDSPVIHRGDLLHCDFGIVYLRLCTDTQQLAYVLREGETDAPKGLKDGLAAGNKLQDIHLAEMKPGRTGNEVLAAALKRAKAEGLRPSIYTHPLGTHGHAAGTLVGMWDMQGGVPGVGDLRFFEDTVHSIELNVISAVPEWGNQDVRFPLEQDAVLTKDGVKFLDQRQTGMHLIK
ncbi:MAG TPA: M24 family metallopeptidase [Vicinamibacterales bacterium]|jgi:Xaa-Pro aminopeptidase